ncbi:DUF6084 family protein [Paractinoplanes rishiriensis]|uniref:Uncharacterized protein n=1 Tax=Paractinoplanes rishiriensis TaxID=1050105 RepID=A0A919K4E4_9ACTN|nr:DUF6084 family protein [Actinoplanes rishiriensis]GIF00591.1 hypothetical protein Ari01nite_80550 [Actinoplanes rishiriensis]
MTSYAFSVLDVVAEPYAVAPQLTARLRIKETTGRRVHAIALRCQVRIEPQRRRYDAGEEDGLRGLFGERARWGDTLKPFQWMQANTTVQGFTGETETDLALPCTYDLDVIGTRYLHALDAGEVPLDFLFSGTIFTRGTSGFEVEQVPWACEARHRLPVTVWREMIAAYFPNSGWLRIGSDVLADLAAFRARHDLISWDETMQRLLAAADRPPS